jgi:hypothetical protein
MFSAEIEMKETGNESFEDLSDEEARLPRKGLRNDAGTLSR